MFDVRALFAALGRPIAAFRPSVPAGDGTAYGRGIAALARHRLQDALDEFESALGEATTGRARAEAHNKRGVALVGLERPADAARAFCDALGEDERLADALANLGTLLLEDGHLQDALDYYEGAIRVDERCALAYRNMAVALRRLGRRAEAVRALRSADRLAIRRSRGRA